VTFTLYGVGSHIPVETNTMALEASGLKVQCLHFFVDEACDVADYLYGNRHELWERVVKFMEA
jgi:hypothetical protein